MRPKIVEHESVQKHGAIRNMALAWVLTLPAAITIAGVLFFVLRSVF